MTDVKLEMFSLCVCSKSWILGRIHLLNMLNFGSFPTTEHTGFWIVSTFYVSYVIQVQLTPLTTRWAPPGRMWYKNSWELLEHFWKMIVCLDIVCIDIWIDVPTVPVWAGRLRFAVRTWDLSRNTSSSHVTCVQSARDGYHCCINCRNHMWHSSPHFC